jgi:hypothetical protein
MNKDKLRKLAQNPKFIAGIYNYCDRWCERCAFTEHCMTFAMEQAENVAGGPHTNAEAFWKRFEASLSLTKELLEELTRERNIQFDPAELEALSRQERQRQVDAEDHPLSKAAFAYDEMVDAWFEAGQDALRGKEEEILAQAKLGVETVKEEIASLTDVVEILRWYQQQIYVKLIRALDVDREQEAASALPSDSDGSAKVALIAMDRSIAAWLRMKEFVPERADSILTMLVHLDRLRRGAEKEFPKARSFVRPGFDTNK